MNKDEILGAIIGVGLIAKQTGGETHPQDMAATLYILIREYFANERKEIESMKRKLAA